MKATKLKNQYNETFRVNDDVLFNISKAVGKSLGTVRNWFYTDSSMLLSYPCLTVMANHAKVSVEDLIEEVDVEEVQS